MPHSFNKHLYHITFSTKKREVNLHPKVRKRLFPYIFTMINNNFGQAYIVNGVADHLHILCEVKPKIAFSEVIRKVKIHAQRTWLYYAP